MPLLENFDARNSAKQRFQAALHAQLEQSAREIMIHFDRYMAQTGHVEVSLDELGNTMGRSRSAFGVSVGTPRVSFKTDNMLEMSPRSSAAGEVPRDSSANNLTGVEQSQNLGSPPAPGASDQPDHLTPSDIDTPIADASDQRLANAFSADMADRAKGSDTAEGEPQIHAEKEGEGGESSKRTSTFPVASIASELHLSLQSSEQTLYSGKEQGGWVSSTISSIRSKVFGIARQSVKAATESTSRTSMFGRHPDTMLNKRFHNTAFDCHVTEGHLISEFWAYESCVAFLIVLNAAYLGFETATDALHVPKHGSQRTFQQYVSGVFCILFTLDIVIRIIELRAQFLIGPEANWNLFDFLVVLIMLFDQLVRHVIKMDADISKLSAIRVLRLLRLLRVLRVFRAFSFFMEFRLLCDFITSSPAWRTMLWVVVLMGMFIYLAALALVQSTLPFCGKDATENVLRASEVCFRFGTLHEALSTLFQICHGGLAWGELIPELQQVGSFGVLILFFFAWFSTTLVTNAVTGVVIRLVNDVAQQSKDFRNMQEDIERDQTFKELCDLFYSMDLDGSRSLSFNEFDIALQNPHISKAFKSLNINTFEMHDLFFSLDSDHNGEVEIYKFLAECMKLRGPARAVDAWILRNAMTTLTDTMNSIEEKLPNRASAHASPDQAPSSPRQRGDSDISHSSIKSLAYHSHGGMLRNLRSRTYKGHKIKRAELRAMLLHELKGVCTWIRADCPAKEWRDQRTGEILTAQAVSLYDFNYYVTCPQGVPDGIVLEGLQDGIFKKGQRVIQKRKQPGPGLPVAIGEVKSDSEGNHVLVQVTQGQFKADSQYDAGIVEVAGKSYGEPTQVVVPNCFSYKELISSRATEPAWYTSHWWGEAVFDFVTCCTEHTTRLGLHQNNASYWVCGYANRQWQLNTEICEDVESCSFQRAMLLSQGTLLILDNAATPFERIWCDFEISRTILNTGKRLDMVTIVRTDDGKFEPVLLAGDTLPHESIHAKVLRESRFPVSLIVKGIRAQLEHGQSTVPSDTYAITRNIIATAQRDTMIEKRLKDGESLEKAVFSQVNNSLHASLALSVWPQAVRTRSVMDLDADGTDKISLPEVLRKDTTLKSFTLNLAHCEVLDDVGLEALGQGLPPKLRHLSLVCTACKNVSDRGLIAMASKLPPLLKSVRFNFEGCVDITDAGLFALSERLGRLKSLTVVQLNFCRCVGIGAPGLRALVQNMPRRLKGFDAKLLGTGLKSSVSSVRQLNELRRTPGAVEKLQGPSNVGETPLRTWIS